MTMLALQGQIQRRIGPALELLTLDHSSFLLPSKLLCGQAYYVVTSTLIDFQGKHAQ